MKDNDRIRRVLTDIAGTLKMSSESLRQRGVTPDKYSDMLVQTGHVASGSLSKNKDLALVGSYNRRPFSMTFHQGSEMSIVTRCYSSCRFCVLRNTLVNRLNIFLGKRVRFGPSGLDADLVARVIGECSMEGFLQKSDVVFALKGIRPFYRIEGSPGSLKVSSDFSPAELRSGPLLEKLQRTLELAELLENSFSSGSDQVPDMVLEQESHS